ncbi:MAG: hypothetical protein CM15mP25_3850 [Gammaproteobacteria bacterium]|nr:MAG: hypothetical protein CM15mP25_3850 [Gammaproteobacteria bacterium]
MWLRSFRGRRRFSTIRSCTAIWKIWFSSWCSTVKLQDRRIELVIVDNPTINAFAVPGGVIGVTAACSSTLKPRTSSRRSWRTKSRISANATSSVDGARQEQGPMQLAGLLAGCY